MKTTLTVIITLFWFTLFSQKYSDIIDSKITLEQWNEEAKTNIRLLPKNGYAIKNQGQKDADKEFMETTVVQFPTNRKASDHLVELGFKYLYRDVKTAMYRFNQAYLLDSTNTDIYWGFGAVYSVLGDLEKAKKQYLEGLTLDSTNTHLLTDYGTYFMLKFSQDQASDKELAANDLDSAITYLTISFQLDKTNPNTSVKLSSCYFFKGDCTNSWKYYNMCKSVGGEPITKELTEALTKGCKIE